MATTSFVDGDTIIVASWLNDVDAIVYDIFNGLSTQTKGDLLASDGLAYLPVAIGTNDHVLTADSSEASGVKWAAASAGLSNVVEDTSPQLGGTLDPNGKTIGRDKGSDMASGSPTVPTDGDYFDVTGTTTISAFVVDANRHFFLQFDGALQLTHNSTDLDLPSEANITTAAGDVAEFFSTGSNDVQCVNYTRANGKALVSHHSASSFGKVLQVVTATTTTQVDVSSTSFSDTGLTADITCAATSSKVLVLVSQSVDHNSRSVGQLKILRDSTGVFDHIGIGDVDNQRSYHFITVLDSPSSTSALTYKTQMARHDQSGTINIQRADDGETSKSTIVLVEVGA